MNESSERQPSAFETFNVYEDKQQDCLEADVPDVIPLTSSNVAGPITLNFQNYKIRLTIIYHYVTHYCL